MELIQEQNFFLRNHVGIPIGGVSVESMKTVLSTHMTLEETEATGLFTDLATTSQTHRTGKGIFMTTLTTDQAAAATKFLDEDFKRAYDYLKDGDKTQFPAFPNPSHMTRNSVPMSYMTSIAKSASTASKNCSGDLAKPPTNAWRSGPPSPIRQKQQKHPDIEASSGITGTNSTQRYSNMES
jgi:hypothetical protein